MVATIVALFVLGLVLLLLAVPRHDRAGTGALFGVGTGVLALTLGMRHAFDADHISAIDNTTRKLMAEGGEPLSVGFFFSLGHSTVVFVLAVLLNFGVRAVDAQFAGAKTAVHDVAGIVGTVISGSFLYVIAALNVVVLVSIVGVFRSMRTGRDDEAELERRLAERGFMNRFFGRLSRRIDRPWKMYVVGVLFGLGFDTASEVALLVLSGTATVSGLPFWAVLSLPLLFAAGMSAFDTADGCFMNLAYGWAFARPVRKVYYNLVVTWLSVAVAFVIGSIELVGLAARELGLGGEPWRWLAGFNINAAGFAIVGLFLATWLIAVAIWRFGRIEERWAPGEAVGA
ncbi:MAG: HoxN/HupN/NixA family nickel/cobalt transporter [Actinomycetota bacterium]|nr:HoxN/HupN/NixA family nickel/cobalt transporter [Actinomycetota bacterium]